MTRILTAIVTVALTQPALLACPVCFQADDSATSHGLRAAVIVLFAVTTGVLSVCGVFIGRFAAREHRENIGRASEEHREEHREGHREGHRDIVRSEVRS